MIVILIFMMKIEKCKRINNDYNNEAQLKHKCSQKLLKSHSGTFLMGVLVLVQRQCPPKIKVVIAFRNLNLMS